MRLMSYLSRFVLAVFFLPTRVAAAPPASQPMTPEQAVYLNNVAMTKGK